MVNYLRISHDACHIIRTRFPHYSTTKYGGLLDKYKIQYNSLFKLSERDAWLGQKTSSNTFTEKENIFKRIFDKFIKLKKDMENLRTNVYNQTPDDVTFLKEIFNTLKKRKGNCGEEAYATTTLLRAKGINATAASLNCKVTLAKGKKSNIDIDHYVTIFNKDGSPFEGKVINNQTIVVDSWANIVDYANNYIKKYRDLLEKVFKIEYMGGNKALIECAKKEGKIYFDPIELDVSQEQFSELAKTFLV